MYDHFAAFGIDAARIRDLTRIATGLDAQTVRRTTGIAAAVDTPALREMTGIAAAVVDTPALREMTGIAAAVDTPALREMTGIAAAVDAPALRALTGLAAGIEMPQTAEMTRISRMAVSAFRPHGLATILAGIDVPTFSTVLDSMDRLPGGVAADERLDPVATAAEPPSPEQVASLLASSFAAAKAAVRQAAVDERVAMALTYVVAAWVFLYSLAMFRGQSVLEAAVDTTLTAAATGSGAAAARLLKRRTDD